MLLSRLLFTSTVCIVVSLITGCHDESNSAWDASLKTLIQQHQLTGDPTRGRELPSIQTPLAQLGKKLFFSKALGGDQDSACVTCHHPTLGGGDELPLSIGVETKNPDLLGKGRMQNTYALSYDGGPNVGRNAPTTFNIALWDKVLFWDGRVESLGKTVARNGNDGRGIRSPDSAWGTVDPLAGTTLAATQARFPVTSVDEMRGHHFVVGGTNEATRTALVNRLKNQEIPNKWGAAFKAVFGDEDITYARIAEALGEYERSQVFVNTAWKRYVQGDTMALSDAAKEGAWLFFTSVAESGAGCSSCHQGDFLTDEGFHVLAMPQIGRGKGDGVTLDDDFGRYRETRQVQDKYAFRTPSLLNVAVTAPYGHDGAYPTLEGVIRHHLNPEQAIANYDFTLGKFVAENAEYAYVQRGNAAVNTQLALTQLKTLQQSGLSSLKTVDLTDRQVFALVAFLHSLTDPCVESRACLAAWIPTRAEGEELDNLHLFAVDKAGNAL